AYRVSLANAQARAFSALLGSDPKPISSSTKTRVLSARSSTMASGERRRFSTRLLPTLSSSHEGRAAGRVRRNPCEGSMCRGSAVCERQVQLIEPDDSGEHGLRDILRAVGRLRFRRVARI